MREQLARDKFKELEEGYEKGLNSKPTALRITYKKSGWPNKAAITSDTEHLWSSPRSYKPRLFKLKRDMYSRDYKQFRTQSFNVEDNYNELAV